MKILSLDLTAWGPFTGKSIDLSGGQEGLHIILGPNEAGKSATLRALRALFFGIPERPQDNFRHDNTQLRIGACLRRSDGTELAVVRRKGRAKTLLAPDQSTLSDDVLKGFLGGVDAGLFSRLFGISHVDLVEGGKDILTGGGGVGESLFSAAMGGGRVRGVLAALVSEAEELYTPRRNANKWINNRLERFAEARRAIKELSLSGGEWEEHNRLLQEAGKEKERTHSALTSLRSEIHRIERLQRALPLIAARQEIVRQQSELGTVLILPAGFAELRRKTSDGLQQCREIKAQADRKIEQIRLQLDSLCIPEALLAEEVRVTELHKALGTHQKAMKDLPKRQAELDQLEHDAGTILAELRPGLSLAEAESLRLQAVTRERVRNLAATHAALVEKQRGTDRLLRSIEAKIRRRQAELEALGDPQESQELRAVLKRWQKQGDIEKALSEARIRLKAEAEQAAVELRKLPLWSGDLNALEALALPPEETIRRFENEFSTLETSCEAIRQRIRELEQRRAELTRNIEALRAAASVPSEEDLAQSRRRREAGWELVRTAWLGNGGDEAAVKAFSAEVTLDRAYERSVQHADDVVDRLRHEADRVAQDATWLAERDRLTNDLRETAEEKEKAEVALSEAGNRWLAIWQPLGIEALTPREMRDWAQRQKSLAERAQKVRTWALEADRIEAQMLACRSELAPVMAALGAPGPGDAETHTRLLERSQCMIEDIEKAEQQRRQLKKTIEGLNADKEDAGIENQGSASDITKWAADWADAVRELGLGEELTPDAANAVLDRIDALFAKLGEASKTRQRIAGMERDSSDFAHEIGNLVALAASDLAGVSAEKAAAELNARMTRAREDRATRANLLEQLQEQELKLEQNAEKERQLELRLRDLCRQAQCEKAEELEAVERTSDLARELREKVDNLTEQLALLVGSGTIEDLIRESQEADADSLSVRREEIGTKVIDLESDLSRSEQTIGEEKSKLALMDGTDRAAEAAEEAQATLAEIRDGVERFIRLRAASALLSAALEGYRTRNQAPVLTRASEIFSALTVGSFSGLRTQYDDEDHPVLVGVRPGEGEEIRVEGMSDGTCDQLYLSLRLASIERHLDANEPLPFIVDDVLVNFDNRRSEATLKELAKLCARTQVIFFTHHQHLVDLAQAALPQNCLYVHSL